MILSGETVADRYIVEGLVGRGGMAVVYRVRHAQLGSAHALKLLAIPRNSLSKRLLLEGQVQARLRHPNVVAVTDVVEVDGTLGLVMEFIDPPTLDDLVREQGTLPVELALSLFAPVVSAVAAAHEAGVLHRDLKPGNVLLARGPAGYVPKVADFGLARLLGESDTPSLTLAGTPMGTPGYMAPEQIRDARGVDARADIFALGAVLYTLLCGDPPWVGDDAGAVMASTLHDPPVPIDRRVPGVPAAVAAAVMRSLAADPAARYPDARAFAAALFQDYPDLLAQAGVPFAGAAGASGERSGSIPLRTASDPSKRAEPTLSAEDGLDPPAFEPPANPEASETSSASSLPPVAAPAQGAARGRWVFVAIAASMAAALSLVVAVSGAAAWWASSSGVDVAKPVISQVSDGSSAPSASPPLPAPPSASPPLPAPPSASPPLPVDPVTGPTASRAPAPSTSAPSGVAPPSGVTPVTPRPSDPPPPAPVAAPPVEVVTAAPPDPLPATVEPAPVAEAPLAAPSASSVLGKWIGKAAGQRMILEVARQKGDAVVGVVRFEVGPTRRSIPVEGTISADGAVALVGDDGGQVRFTGRLAGAQMSGMFLREGAKSQPWSVQR